MIENGCKEMSLLTGTGCICSALTGLFLGADTKAVYSAAQQQPVWGLQVNCHGRDMGSVDWGIFIWDYLTCLGI